jgi:hypothetical protein
MQIAEPVGFCRVQKNAHVGQFTIIYICAGCIIEKAVTVHFQAYRIRTFFLVTGPVRPDRSIKLNRPVFTGLERFLDRPDRTGLVFFRPVTTLADAFLLYLT